MKQYGSIPSSVKSSSRPTLYTVTSGRRCIGFIVPRGRAGYEATTDDHKILGLYASAKEAADALYDIAERAGSAS